MISAPGHVTSTNVIIGRKISADLASDTSEISMETVDSDKSHLHTIPGVGLSAEVRHYVNIIVCARINSDFVFQIIPRHSIFYRYDVHDTILLIHIHFGSILVIW